MNPPRPFHRRALRELLLATALLLVGVLALPAAVYHTGGRLFGPYSQNGGGMGTFYAELLDVLGDGNAAAWLLVASPWLCVTLCRLAVRLWRHRPEASTAGGN